MHVFQIAAPMVPEADRSLRQIGNYIREATDRFNGAPHGKLVAQACNSAQPPHLVGRQRGSSA
jgi:hypothetical protein